MDIMYVEIKNVRLESLSGQIAHPEIFENVEV